MFNALFLQWLSDVASYLWVQGSSPHQGSSPRQGSMGVEFMFCCGSFLQLLQFAPHDPKPSLGSLKLPNW